MEDQHEQRPCGCLAHGMGGAGWSQVVKGRQGPGVGEMRAKDRKAFRVCVEGE